MYLRVKRVPENCNKIPFREAGSRKSKQQLERKEGTKKFPKNSKIEKIFSRKLKSVKLNKCKFEDFYNKGKEITSIWDSSVYSRKSIQT
jgi:hypothetical protein